MEHSLWRSVRWPILVLAAGLAGVVAAFVLDEVFSSEWSLTIGALHGRCSTFSCSKHSTNKKLRQRKDFIH